jgi:hypothetical protein
MKKKINIKDILILQGAVVSTITAWFATIRRAG